MSPEKCLRGITLLVVDDEELLREVLVEEFQFHAARCFQAENGQAALQLIRTYPVHAIISDVRMPNGDGRYLLSEVRRLGSGVPKLFLCTGFNDISASEAQQLGVTEIFAKPINLSLVVETVAKAVRSSLPEQAASSMVISG